MIHSFDFPNKKFGIRETYGEEEKHPIFLNDPGLRPASFVSFFLTFFKMTRGPEIERMISIHMYIYIFNLIGRGFVEPVTFLLRR